MRRQFVKAASAANMLNAFEAKLAELDSNSKVDSATAVDMLNAFQGKIDELEGIESSSDITAAEEAKPQDIFMLIDYVPDNGENGMEGDDFYSFGKFFAEDIDDAKAQLESVYATEPDRMSHLDNPYVSEYNEYFDDGDEVYQDLHTLVIRNIRSQAEIDADPTEFDEYGNPVFNSTKVEAATDPWYNAAFSFELDEKKLDEVVNDIYLNDTLADEVAKFEAAHDGEVEPGRLALEVGYGLSNDDYKGVPPFTVYILDPKIGTDSDLVRELAIPGTVEVYDQTVESCNQVIGSEAFDLLNDDDLEELEMPDDQTASVNTDADNWELVDRKQIEDTDGFLTDYTLYRNIVTNWYICVYGDSEIYRPEDGDWDADFASVDEAIEWFDSYGLDD